MNLECLNIYILAIKLSLKTESQFNCYKKKTHKILNSVSLKRTDLFI